MLDELTIRSRDGSYRVRFAAGDAPELDPVGSAPTHVLVDERVQSLHPGAVHGLLERTGAATEPIVIHATEAAKSYGAVEGYVRELVARGVRRGDLLLAIGGGIVQDITCFIASVLFRGMRWGFVPTTLLAQADSCIGSKSSINLGQTKNLVGTFCAPAFVEIWTGFLATLTDRELRSGVGEIYKIHILSGPEHFQRFDREYAKGARDGAGLTEHVRSALVLKQPYVESDELDQGGRRLLNYGHTFGHAIEAATDFAIPHGIAVALGMDLANSLAWAMGRVDAEACTRMARALRSLALPEHAIPIDPDAFLSALGRDKKHVAGSMRMVLLDESLEPELVSVVQPDPVHRWCRSYLAERQTSDPQEWCRRGAPESLAPLGT